MIASVLSLIFFAGLIMTMVAIARRKSASCGEGCECCMNHQTESEHPIV